MSGLEIIAGSLALLSGLIIILIVLFQDSKDQGMSSAISGSANDSYFGQNSGRTKESKMNNIVRIFAIVLFLASIAVYIFAK